MTDQVSYTVLGACHNTYYQIRIMTDFILDKGLLINCLDCFFPTLLKVPNFLVEFVTPIVRVSLSERTYVNADGGIGYQ